MFYVNRSKLKLFCSLHVTERQKVQLQRGSRFAKEAKEQEKLRMKKEMVMKNLKLYIKNQSIIQENERLRNKACRLHQENQTLFVKLQKVSDQSHHNMSNNHRINTVCLSGSVSTLANEKSWEG